MKSSGLEKASALRAVAKEARSNIVRFFSVSGPHMLSAEEKERRVQDVNAIADKLDSLAKDVEQESSVATYKHFESILDKLREAGATPAKDLTSAVAEAFFRK